MGLIKKNEYYLKQFLKFAGKKDSLSANKIRRAFLMDDLKDEFSEQTSICHGPQEVNSILLNAYNVIKEYKSYKAIPKMKTDKTYQSFRKEIGQHLDAFEEFLKSINTQNVKYFYESVNPSKLNQHQRLFKQLQWNFIELKMFYDDHTIGKGKQNNWKYMEALRLFVRSAAVLFEDISHDLFKVIRHKDEKKAQYGALTNGMDFVWLATEWLQNLAREEYDINLEISSENIQMSCEWARKDMNQPPDEMV